MSNDTPRVSLNRIGQVGIMVFDNPARLNAFSDDMALEATAILDDLENDPDLRVLVLRGAGEKAFISGGDISKFKETRFKPAVNTGRKPTEVFRERLEAFPGPTIAMIHGYCLGGGMAVALSADLRFGADDCQLGIPAALRGLAYPLSSLEALMQLVGPSVSKDLLYSGRRVKAEEAFRLGLLNFCYPKEELEQKTLEYAEGVAGNAPLSIHASKVSINQLQRDAALRDLELIKTLQDRAQNSADFREATLAFMEKRKPVFRGE